jgi:peptide/nickel transport system substrate-binding protein
VTFSNGQPLTAADVVFSLELAVKSPYFVLFGEKIKSIEATSPTTIEIVTKQPVPALPSILAVPITAVVPKNYDGVSEQEFARHPIGTGPFTLASWKQGQEIVLQRNPHYWEHGKPYLSRVVFVTTSDDNARIARLKSGELDAVEAPPPSSLSTLEELPEIEVAESEPTISSFVVLNTRNPLFKNPDVRKAVTLAIDRKGVLQAAIDGHGVIGGSYFPPSILYADESISAPAQNMAEAKSLLAAAVREDGVKPEFTLLIPSGETLQSNTAQIIQQNLEGAGFTVQIEPMDNASFLEQLENGNFDAAVSGAYSTVSDPAELANYYVGEDGLYTGALTKAQEQLVAEAEKQFDSQKRQNAYYAFQESVAAANAVVQLNYQPFVWALNSKVVGFKVQANGNLTLRETGFAK